MTDQPQRPQLVSIEGGRAIAAARVQEALQDSVDDLLNSTPNIAGYFIMVWDDDGYADSHNHYGAKSPLSPAMVVDMVTQRAALHAMASE